ncbi:hypothetical protein EV426DRAFT_716551 [Tirmania nivea]|nr:hypothetical protein EV426DRAFT_716551 [Tirmania nivea]
MGAVRATYAQAIYQNLAGLYTSHTPGAEVKCRSQVADETLASYSGTTPAALLADNPVTLTDINLQVHLPAESLTTTLEQHTLSLLQEHIFRIPPTLFPGKIFTTATTTNILGLACGREHIFSTSGISVDELRLLEASHRSGIEGKYPDERVGILSGATTEGSKRGVIVVMSWGEVNTGKFTSGIREVRKLADKYSEKTKTWIHVDGGLGGFARLFWTEDGEGDGVDERLVELERDVDGFVTADAHKMLNVVGHYVVAVFSLPNLHLSLILRCLRAALHLYATLIAYSASGYQQLITILILHAHILNHPAYELLPAHLFTSQSDIDKHIFTIVLFQAKDDSLSKILKEREGRQGCMRDNKAGWEDGGVRDVLDGVAMEWEAGQRG